MYVSQYVDRALLNAEEIAAQMGDEYTSVEHLFMGIIDSPSPDVKKLFAKYRIDRESFMKFVRIRQYPPALEKAVSMLAARACSRQEILSRLKRNCYDPEVIDLVLLKLEKENLLDDYDFSEQWVRSRMKKYGSVRLGHELRMKGIDAETAKEILEQIPEEDQLETAQSLAEKKIASMIRQNGKDRLQQRVTAVLIRRGYPCDLAVKAFKRAMEKFDEEV